MLFKLINRFTKFFLVIILSSIVFIGCGSNKNKAEAKELLQKILQVVGIPYDIVVNICQDGNGDGICNATEVTAKITINKSDTIDTIFEKIKLDKNGRYILANYDPNKKILMELEDNEAFENTKQRVTIPYNPKPVEVEQELSILQALLDRKLLIDIDKLKKSKNSRTLIDKVILSSLFFNQKLLEQNNMDRFNATERNLDYIAEGLRDINITGDFVNRLDGCDKNTTCTNRILLDAKQQTEISEEEAKRIAKTNSINGTGDRNTLITIEEYNSTKNEDNTTTPTSDNEDNDSPPNNYQPPVQKTTTKHVSDAYLIHLSEPVEAICGDSRYQSILRVDAQGLITFNVELPSDCIITVPTGSIIDSDGDGNYNANIDKPLAFNLIGNSDLPYISPLSTFLISKNFGDENDYIKFKNMIKNFDPIASINTIQNNSSLDANRTKKLIFLQEVIKNLLNRDENLSSINISSILDDNRHLDNIYLDELIYNIPYPKKIEAIKRVLIYSNEINSSIDLTKLIINISDGETTLKEAIENSLNDNSNPLDFYSISDLSLYYVNQDINDYLFDKKYRYEDRFITKWKTDNNGTSANNQISILTNDGNYSYNYSIKWGDDANHIDFGVAGDINHTYSTVGTYTVEIAGDFPHLFMKKNDDGNSSTIDSDAKKIVSVEQWGKNRWKSMYGMFYNASNLDLNNTYDTPNLSGVTDMSYMFYNAVKFDKNIGDWNISKVKDMSGMFGGVKISTNIYDEILNGWNSLSSLERNVTFDGGDSQYSNTGKTGRDELISAYDWNITDGGELYPPIGG